jgi:hypothetical protein
MSISAYSKAFQSQQLGQQSQVVNTSDDLGESNIPSDLGSPDKLLSRRPLKSKKRTSTSMFQETLDGKKDQQEQDSEEIPSTLESPGKKQEVSRLENKSKMRMSTTTFKKVLEDQQEQDSEDKPSSLESPAKKQEVSRLVNKSKSRMSTRVTKKTQEDEKEQDSVEIPSALESPEKMQQINRLVKKSKTRMSTTAFNKALQSQKEQDPGEMKKSKALLETPTKGDSDLSDDSDMPELESSDDFSPSTSSTQITKSKHLMTGPTVEPREKNDIPASSESPLKGPTLEIPNVLVSKRSNLTAVTSHHATLPLVDEEIEEKGTVSRTSSRASNKSSSSLNDSKRSAVPLSASGNLWNDNIPFPSHIKIPLLFSVYW